MNYFDINWLKANHQMIHYFGLGFIQLKLNDHERMHFYTPELPPITPKEDIHNHRYDFKSKILKGVFDQELFQVVEGTDHILEQESCKAGVTAQAESKLCSVKTSSVHTYRAGSEYKIDHGTFHRVEANYAITLLHRGVYRKDFAEVIRPVGSTKVCPFSHKVKEDRLWQIVEDMVKDA